MIYNDEKFNNITSKITIYSYTSTIEESNKIRNSMSFIDDFGAIEKCDKIIVSNYEITKKISLFILLYKNCIYIIDETKDIQYLKTCRNFLIFLNDKCQEEFDGFIQNYKSNIIISENNLNSIKTIIINLILKRSQISTQEKFEQDRTESLTKMRNFKIHDFVTIEYFKENVILSYNTNDQFLYILKSFNANDIKSYMNELNFYEEIGNKLFFSSKLYGVIIEENKFYLIIGYINGTTLNDFILSNKNKLTETIKVKIIVEIFMTLYFIHLRGYVFRDLKWDNIMIDFNNDAIFIDFDQCKKIQSDHNENIENKTGDIGSHLFMSPELYNGESYSIESDIYSLGMIIYFIITEQPIDKIIMPKTIDEIFRSKKNIIRGNYLPSITQEYIYFKIIIERCLEFSPKLRPTTSDLFSYLYSYFEKKNDDEMAKMIIDINHKFQNLVQYDIIDIDESVKYVKLQKDQNNSQMNLIIGLLFYNGNGVKKDIVKSIHYLTLAADENNSDAQFFLGKIYFLDEYIEKDIPKSIHYLNLASNNGNVDALLFLSMIYFEGNYVSKNIEKSIHYLELAADKNNIDALFLLGSFYYANQFTTPDINKSIHYLKKASKFNCSEAQYLLGEMYYSQQYIPQNINKSIKYLSLASEQNNSKAQYLLGVIYFIGRETKQDIYKSIHYLTLSSNQNNSCAMFILSVIYYIDQFVPRDINKSIHYLTLSSNQNNSNAQFVLGVMHYYGLNVQHDVKKSIYYLTLASEQNNSYAQFFIAYIYYTGKDIIQDIDKSIYYFTLLSNQNNSYAQYFLGEIYYNGTLVPQNINKSIHYLKLSSDQENPCAMYTLGKLYYYGKFV